MHGIRTAILEPTLDVAGSDFLQRRAQGSHDGSGRARAHRPQQLFTFEPSSSTGVRSGLYTGKGSTRAPTASIAAITCAFLCGCKLSHTTTSPACNSGTNTFGTYVPNTAPSVAPSNTNGATTSAGRTPTISVTF